jgi:hypothetical protein
VKGEKMKNETKTRLIRLAAKLVMCNRLDDPTEFCRSLPASTSKKTVKKIFNSLERANMASKDAAVEIRSIIDFDDNR